MELTHGHHFMARRLAVVDGPNGMCNALAFHMPQKLRYKIGDLIARCYDEQFRYVDRTLKETFQAGVPTIAFVDEVFAFNMTFLRRTIVTDGGSQLNKVIYYCIGK